MRSIAKLLIWPFALILSSGCTHQLPIQKQLFNTAKVIRLSDSVLLDLYRIDTRITGGYSYSLKYYRVLITNHSSGEKCFHPRFDESLWVFYKSLELPGVIPANSVKEVGTLKQRSLNFGFEYYEDIVPTLIGSGCDNSADT